MEGLSDLLATADDLYGLVPEAFTAARDARVRELRRSGSAARALAVQGLRRPCLSAWLVNALARHRRDEIEALLEVGRALREAHDTLDSGQLRDLGRQRQAVLAALVRDARALAAELGRPVRDQVLAEVEETLRAALADQTAANAVRAGRLTTALAYAGFGDGGAPGAAPEHRMVVPRTPTTRAPAATTDAAPETPRTARSAASPGDGDAAALREAGIAVAAAEDAARQAEGAALAAENHRDVLARRARTAQERLEAAHAEMAELESLLAAARVATSTAAAAWAPLHAEADAAAARAETARRLADTARALLGSARAHLAQVDGGRRAAVTGSRPTP